jgi:hypothetical protein
VLRKEKKEKKGFHSMIFFEGTDNKLWRANPDGSAGVNLGGYKTRSTPVVSGDYVYFQGTDDKLWKIKTDGTGGTNLAGYKCKSSPTVTGTNVFFQGTDDKLWKINLDGSGGTNLGGYKCSSSPAVAGGYVYFQGTDYKLWKIRLDGSNGINLGLYQTRSTPFVTDRYVFFQGTDNKLWRINLDGTGGSNLKGYQTISTPFATPQHVYFQGTDNKLWQINLDGSGGTNLGGYKCRSSPTVDTSSGFVYFQGTDNALWRINLDGSHGDHIHGFNTASTPFVVQPANQPQTGSARLPYVVLFVLYAPPGANGGKSGSSVDYGNGSTTGATTNLSQSFKAGVSINASAGLVGNQGSVTVSASTQTTDSASLDIKKTATFDISVGGPPADGIDHSKDRIYLWLNPLLTFTIDPENNLNWQLGAAGPTMIIQYLEVAWLKNPALIPAGVQQQLTAAGVKPADYANILQTNPFASGAAAIDSNRFLPTSQSFPYEPPDSASDPVPVQKYVQTNTVTNTATHTVQTQYGVSLSAEGGFNLGVIKASLKVTDTFEWTNTSTSTTTNGSSQSATVAVGGPAVGYTGPTDVLVYWDTVYNSFMFAFPAVAASVSGVLMDKLGKPVPHTAVTLSSGPHTFKTFTDSKGRYRFYGAPAGQVKIAAVQEEFTLAAGKTSTTLQLTRS